MSMYEGKVSHVTASGCGPSYKHCENAVALRDGPHVGEEVL